MPKGFDGREVATAADAVAVVIAKLKSSGLSEKDGKKLGIYPLSGAETSKRGFWRGAPHIAMCIPYYGPDGEDWQFQRARCLTDPLPVLPPNKDGKAVRFAKYEQTKGTQPHAYFPRSIKWLPILTDPSKPIILTEGELKAAAASARGYPTIGLGGVWNFMSSEKEIEFLDELNAINWTGRKIYIAYDSDFKTNKDIRKAVAVLAGKIIDRGGTPYQIMLPSLSRTAKTGLDDYLLTAKNDEFEDLIAKAPEIKSWKHRYQFGNSGPLNNFKNVVTAFTFAPELIDILKFDEMSQEVAVVAPLPGETNFKRRHRTDNDTLWMQDWLQGEGDLRQIGTEAVRAGMDFTASKRSFHPIRDFLRSITWDKVPRIDNWITTYLGAEDSPYTKKVGAMFLIQMVARVEAPGCQADYALVIEGAQGRKKSSLCGILAGEEWFSDHLPDIGDDEKRVSQHLRGKWIIEIAELGAMKKSDIEDVKKFISRKVEKFTPMFGHAAVVEPRQCVFVGTTNDDRYLKDETGNRRWWPILATKIDLTGFRAVRDQLLAEAFVRYQAGEESFPEEAFEEMYIKPEQELRFAGGEWDEKIGDYLEASIKQAIDAKRLDDLRISTTDVAECVLSIDVKNMNPEVSRKIGAAMRRLKWICGRSNGIRRFSPPPAVLVAHKLSRPELSKKVVDLVSAKSRRAGKKY